MSNIIFFYLHFLHLFLISSFSARSLVNVDGGSSRLGHTPTDNRRTFPSFWILLESVPSHRGKKNMETTVFLLSPSGSPQKRQEEFSNLKSQKILWNVSNVFNI